MTIARALVAAALLCIPLAAWPAAHPSVHLLSVRGPIGPATGDFVIRGIDRAEAEDAEAVVLRLDTPGGLDAAMRDIIQRILAATVPVIGYVAPGGARAASAGTYILYACHVAAMAPATNLGAATPVQIGAPGSPGPPGSPEPRPEPNPERQPDAGDGEARDPALPVPAGDSMKRKIVNDAVAYIRGLAELRGRNADWAEAAVRRAESLSATEAAAMNVVDLVAEDLEGLLQAVDGRRVKLATGEHALRTAGASVLEVEPDWRTRLLAVLTNPNVAYILMLLGIYGLFFEFSNPGFVLPGVAGAICLLLALFAFQVLPINYAGLALIALGIAFMVAEAFMPSFGALGIGGLIAFVIGSIMLLDTGAEGFEISLALIGGVAATSFAFFVGVLGFALRARRRPVVSGREQLVGCGGEALEDFERSGRVLVHSEAWDAESERPLRRGERILVTGRRGLKLQVRPAGEEPP